MSLNFKSIEPQKAKDVTQENETPEIIGIETVTHKPEQPKKRGRPRKTEVEKKIQENEKKQENEIEKELRELREQYDKNSVNEGVEVIEKSQEIVKNEISLINGYMLLIFCDVFFPFVISYLFKGKLRDAGKSKKDIKLTKEEKKELEPLADAAAKELSLNMSAIQTFALTMLFMYADKIE